MCTAKHVRQYFREGTLPKEGTVCEVDEPIFKSDLPLTKVVETPSAEDASLRDAMKEITERIKIPFLGMAF